ncbi:unnamed protein product [Allacma fusca]|uniref:Uncharacterized protein n=1 Tax=Allacma fusca TaxID=39272 RepID=A0A8J2LKP7_9HEXA|nr:unnamed protein product [Allacma fusca]
MIKPTHRYFNVGDSSYNKIVANEFQHPFNFRMIRKPESNILGFLSYFIPYTAAAIIFTGLLFYLFFGFPAGLRGWLRKEFQGLFGVGRNHPSDSLQFRVDSFRNTPTANLLGQVRMALEGSWLQKLQENIERDYGEYPGTYTQCCVLPSEGPLGMVDCQIFRQGGMRKRRTRCSSNLIYNFEFGQGQNHRKNTKKSKKRGSFAQ